MGDSLAALLIQLLSDIVGAIEGTASHNTCNIDPYEEDSRAGIGRVILNGVVAGPVGLVGAAVVGVLGSVSSISCKVRERIR